MPRKISRENKLHQWEVRLVKAMLARGSYNDQDILAYFTRPGRTINHARIKEIRDGAKHGNLRSASEEDLARFLSNWPLIDGANGLHLADDELLIKAREALLLAVQCYNNPKTWFRSEVFIVLAIIAWTYLLHAYYKKIGIDFRYKEKNGDVAKTKNGAEKYWELEECLKYSRCPLDIGVKNNLIYLIHIRHEIEHRMTTRIDDFISAKLQACCLNFNRTIKKLFDERLGFDKELSFALQFAAFDTEQKRTLFRASDLPANISAAHEDFENKLSDDEAKDTHYTYRVAFVQIVVNRKGKADQVYEIITPESPEQEQEITRVLLKDREKEKYKPKQIVELIKGEGYPKFTMKNFVDFWKLKDGKNAGKGYGVQLLDGQWYWYENFIDLMREYCAENIAIFR